MVWEQTTKRKLGEPRSELEFNWRLRFKSLQWLCSIGKV